MRELFEAIRSFRHYPLYTHTAQGLRHWLQKPQDITDVYIFQLENISARRLGYREISLSHFLNMDGRIKS